MSTDVSLTPVSMQQGNCPVCGQPMRPPARTCPDCATPHHLDCWSYNHGCAIFGCAEKAERAPAPVTWTAEALPEKILLPQVAMAFFSGLQYFPPVFTAWCLFWVVFAAPYLYTNFPIALACYGLVALGVVAGGCWSERYNLDLKQRAITRSWLLGRWEVAESRVASFDDLRVLYVGPPGDHLGPVALNARIKAFLFDPVLALTPGLRPGTREHAEVQRLLEKLDAFSVLPVAVHDRLPAGTGRSH